MTSRTVAVANRLGMHARAAARFVREASRFEARIRVGRDRRWTDGKSILGLLLLAGAQGVELTITADGVDEVEAVTRLCDLVTSGFGEEGS